MSYNPHSQKMIIISAPSGAGKTTLVHHLLQEIPSLTFSVSCTTRKKREYETHEKDYYFISEKEFKQKIKNNEFVEYEEVYLGSFYGTLRSEITKIWQQNKSVIFDIDVEGGLNIKKQYPKALAIFIAPPTLKTLEKRLTERNTESPETLQKRIEKAQHEISYQAKFDCTIINDNLETAKQEIIKLVQQYLQS